MAKKDIQTNVIISAEAKGIAQAEQTIAGANKLVTQGLAQQAVGFANLEKQTASYSASMDKVRQAISGTNKQVKAQIDDIINQFSQFEDIDAENVKEQVAGIEEQLLGLVKTQTDIVDKLSFENIQIELENLQAQLQDLAKEQLATTNLLAQVDDKASPAYKRLTNHLKELGAESTRVQKNIAQLEQAFKKQVEAAKEAAEVAKQAKGSFTQGFMQGALPMPFAFLQRGPGMMQQAMGMGAGATLRQGAGGISSAPFVGVQGLQQAVQALPIVGEVAAGYLGSGMQLASQALQFQKQQLELMPSLENPLAYSAKTIRANKIEQQMLSQEAIYAEGEKAAREARVYPTTTNANLTSDILDALQNPAKQAAGFNPKGIQIIPETPSISVGEILDKNSALIPGTNELITRDVANKVGKTFKQLTIKELEATKAKQAVEVENLRKLNVGSMETMGTEFGLTLAETQQRLATITQIGGGNLQDLSRQNLTETALAAQRMFGVGPEVSGQLLKGGRRGGLVGGFGQAGIQLVEGLQDAVKLGLSGSEINNYLNTIAQGVQRWEATGIPFNRESLTIMTQELGKAGLAAPRAQNLAQGMQNYVQSMAQRGVQSGLDLMLLRSAGFEGRGAEDLQKTLIKLEEMVSEIGPEGITGIGPDSPLGQVFRQVIDLGGGGFSGMSALGGVLRRNMGLQISARELNQLGANLTGEQPLPLSANEAARIKFEEKERTKGAKLAGLLQTPEQLTKLASTITPKTLKDQAALENKQLAIGSQMITLQQNLNTSVLATTTAFTNLAAKPLTDLSSGFVNLTGKIESLSKTLTDKNTSLFDTLASLGKMALGL